MNFRKPTPKPSAGRGYSPDHLWAMSPDSLNWRRTAVRWRRSSVMDNAGHFCTDRAPRVATWFVLVVKRCSNGDFRFSNMLVNERVHLDSGLIEMARPSASHYYCPDRRDVGAEVEGGRSRKRNFIPGCSVGWVLKRLYSRCGTHICLLIQSAAGSRVRPMLIL